MKLKTEKFGKVQELKYGKALKTNERKSGKVPVYGSNGIIGHHNAPLVKTSGIILGRKGSFGKVHYVQGPFWPIDTTYYIESSNEFDLKFLFYLLKYMKLDRVNLHVAVPGLSRSDVYKKVISYPKDIIDQKRIAKVLSDCEQLIQWRKESIQLLDNYLESTFLEMFGDPRVKSVMHDFGAIKDLLGEVVTGNTPPRKDPSNYGNHIEWIKTDNLSNDTKLISQAVEYLSIQGAKKARIVDSGSLLVTCIAGSLNSIGTCGMTDRKISFNQQINAIVPFTDVDSEFVYWMLKICKSHIQQHAKKGMKKIITKGMFEKIMFIKPEYELQLKFSEISKQIAAVKLESYKSLSYLEDLYYSISQKAFKGELNLT